MPHGQTPRDLDAVLFDLDGTLIDSVPAIVRGLGDLVEEETGVRPSDEYARSLIGIPLREQFRIYRLSAQPSSDERLVARALELFERYAELETVFTPALDALRTVQAKGIATGLVTSKSRPEVDLFLARHPFGREAGPIVSSSDVVHPKPHPMSVHLAAHKLGVAPERTALVGDSVHDVRCARDAGALAVAVAYGAGRSDDLAAAGPALLLPTPRACTIGARPFNPCHAPQESCSDPRRRLRGDRRPDPYARPRRRGRPESRS